MAKVLVTGASGFVGRSLSRELRLAGHEVRPAGRQEVGEIGPTTDWAEALRDTEVVMHLAARVHVMSDRATDALAEFRRVNTAGTLTLARQAAAAGVRRFVFVSSVKVNGEETLPAAPFRADDVPRPSGPYAVSKHEAEQGLCDISRDTGLEIVIIRPPLVYGPGVGANFERMMRWLQRGVPLPLGAIDNRRSLVAMGNLVDLLRVCTDHPTAANQVFLVADGEDLSTTALLQRLAAALGRPARLVSVPARVLRGGAALVGLGAMAQRLCGSLQVDTTKARALLGWAPPLSVEQAMQETARDFLVRARR